MQQLTWEGGPLVGVCRTDWGGLLAAASFRFCPGVRADACLGCFGHSDAGAGLTTTVGVRSAYVL